MERRVLLVAVLLVGLVAPAAWAGIYYEQEMKMPEPMGTGKMVCYISGAKMRVESTMQGMQTVVISRFDTGVFYNLMPAQKMCMEIPIPKPDPQGEAQVQATVTKTGETKKIGDYNCTRYDVTLKGMPGMPAEGVTQHYWMTTDVDVAEEFEKFSGIQARKQSVKLATEMTKLKGFPIMTEMSSPQGPITMTVTTVKKQDIADSMFEVPADYQKMSIPTGPTAPEGTQEP